LSYERRWNQESLGGSGAGLRGGSASSPGQPPVRESPHLAPEPQSARYNGAVTDAQFSVSNGQPGPVVKVAGQLDLAVKDELRELLSPLTGVVTIDLSEVTFVDSSTIGVFVGVHKRLESEGGALRLRNPQDMPRLALETVGLQGWIDD